MTSNNHNLNNRFQIFNLNRLIKISLYRWLVFKWSKLDPNFRWSKLNWASHLTLSFFTILPLLLLLKHNCFLSSIFLQFIKSYLFLYLESLIHTIIINQSWIVTIVLVVWNQCWFIDFEINNDINRCVNQYGCIALIWFLKFIFMFFVSRYLLSLWTFFNVVIMFMFLFDIGWFEAPVGSFIYKILLVSTRMSRTSIQHSRYHNKI